MKNEEKEQILKYIKVLMKEFNTIILLLLSALFLNYFPHLLFRILFIIDILIIGYKITQLNVFLDKLEETFVNEENVTQQESYLMNCRKGVPKKEIVEEVAEEITEEMVDDAVEEIEPNEEVIEAEVKEEVQEEEKPKDVLYEVEKMDNKKEYVNEFDYFEDVQFESSLTDVEEVKEEIKEEKIEMNVEVKNETELIPDIDISKCIRKLPKGKKASQKAIDLAKSYGYELKEGETFVKPKK